jgi:hypothetical protein
VVYGATVEGNFTNVPGFPHATRFGRSFQERCFGDQTPQKIRISYFKRFEWRGNLYQTCIWKQKSKIRNSRFAFVNLRVVQNGTTQFIEVLADIMFAGVSDDPTLWTTDPDVPQNAHKVLFCYIKYFKLCLGNYGYMNVLDRNSPGITFVDLRTIICPAIVLQDEKNMVACKFLEDQGRKKGFLNQ